MLLIGMLFLMADMSEEAASPSNLHLPNSSVSSLLCFKLAPVVHRGKTGNQILEEKRDFVLPFPFTNHRRKKMKSKVMVIVLVSIGVAASAWAQGGSAAKGKTIVENKNCALCHKQGGLAQPLDTLAKNHSEARLKKTINHPKETLGSQTKMPEFKLTDQQVQDVIAYLQSIAH